MTKTKVKETVKKVKSILISQQRPADTEKSPYFELEKKHKVKLTFCPFIVVEGISAKEFRKQKIEIPNYTAIIFTSRYAVDYFFRLCEEMRIKVSSEMKYFCITEAIALYLQKFILYRKRKVFFGEDGSIKGLIKIIEKQKTKEKFIVPCSDINKKDVVEFLEKQELEYAEAILYKTICNDVKEVLAQEFDLILFFSPSGVKSLFENKPDFVQGEIAIGAFGPTTCKAIEDLGLNLHIRAPMPNAPSMVSALDMFLSDNKKKAK